MPRPLRHDFTGETLYRRIRPSDIDEGRIRSSAVSLPRCSFDRSRWRRNPRAVLALEAQPEHTAIAQLPADELPIAVSPRGTDSDSLWLYELRPRDAPTDENPAHCEVAVFTATGAPVDDGKLIRPNAVTKKLKRALAGAMSLYVKS